MMNDPRRAKFQILIEALLDAGYSAEEIARKSNTTANHIHKIKRGERHPSFWLGVDLIEAFEDEVGTLVP